MIPAPLLRIRPQNSYICYIRALHYAVCHVHEGASHSAPWPRVLQVVFGIERLVRDRHTGRLNSGEQRESLHPFVPIRIVHVVVVMQLQPVVRIVAMSVDAYSRLLEAHPVRRPRCAVRPRLCKGRLALDAAVWT